MNNSNTDWNRRRILRLAALAAPVLASPALGSEFTSMQREYDFVSAPDGIHWISRSGSRGLFLPLGLSFALTPGSISPVNGHLAYTALDRRTGSNIWTVPVLIHDKPRAGTPVPFFHAGTFDVNPVFSADGRQITYASRDVKGWKLQKRSFHGAV